MLPNYDTVGTMLRNHPVQYKAVRDDLGTWRILNRWHNDVADLTDVEIDIPDASPAVTVISEGAFMALLKTVQEEGYHVEGVF